MTDKFEKFFSNLESPFENMEAAVLSNTEDLQNFSRGIYVGVGGDLNVIPVGSETPILLKNLIQGAVYPFRIKRILVTNTTASDIVIGY